MKCSHTQEVERAISAMDWDMGEEVSQIVTETVETFKYINTKQYTCVQCNEMFYHLDKE